MLRGFHLSSRGTVSAGVLWRRSRSSGPPAGSGDVEIAAPLSTRLQQLQQQTSLTTDLNCARAAGSSALGSPPDDAVALLHSNLVLPHASLLVHSYIPPGTRKKLCGFGRKVAAWLLCD